jgi:hypothetical protein
MRQKVNATDTDSFVHVSKLPWCHRQGILTLTHQQPLPIGAVHKLQSLTSCNLNTQLHHIKCQHVKNNRLRVFWAPVMLCWGVHSLHRRASVCPEVQILTQIRVQPWQSDVRSQYLMMAPLVVSKHVARKLCFGCVYLWLLEKLVIQTEVRNPYIYFNFQFVPTSPLQRATS